MHPDWQFNAFMYAPMATALLLPLPPGSGLAEKQRRALELLSQRIASTKITQYYSGSWLALATATLNGDVRASCARLFGPRPPQTPRERLAVEEGGEQAGYHCPSELELQLVPSSLTRAAGHASGAPMVERPFRR